MRFKKVHFLGPKGPLFGGPAPPKIDPGYRPGSLIGTCTSLNLSAPPPPRVSTNGVAFIREYMLVCQNLWQFSF